MKITLLFCFLFVGCGATQIHIDNTLDPEIQQQIKTSNLKGAQFSYTTHENAERVIYEWPLYSIQYNVNEAFRGMAKELIETKFGDISESSENKISIKIEDLVFLNTTTMNAQNHSVNMKVGVQGTIQGKSFSKSFAYETSISAPTANVVASYTKEAIGKLLTKFIIAIDKFIDSQVDIKG